jgi:hypothetical protein
MRLSTMKVDPELESKGVWVDFGEGFECLIARDQNPEHRALLRRLMKKYRGFDEIPEDRAREIDAKAMAKCIVLDWRGLLDDDDTEIPYSEGKAYEILVDPAYRPLVAKIKVASATNETFRPVSAEATAKNSPTSSSGTSTTGTKRSRSLTS